MSIAICGRGKFERLIQITNELSKNEKILMVTNSPEKFQGKLDEKVHICQSDNIELDNIVKDYSVIAIDEKENKLKDDLDYFAAIGKVVYYTLRSSLLRYDDLDVGDEIIYVDK